MSSPNRFASKRAPAPRTLKISASIPHAPNMSAAAVARLWRGPDGIVVGTSADEDAGTVLVRSICSDSPTDEAWVFADELAPVPAASRPPCVRMTTDHPGIFHHSGDTSTRDPSPASQAETDEDLLQSTQYSGTFRWRTQHHGPPLLPLPAALARRVRRPPSPVAPRDCPCRAAAGLGDRKQRVGGLS